MASLEEQYELDLIEKAVCEESFYHFFQFAWHTLHQEPLITNWAVEAMAEHLQWLHDGEIPNNKLQILVPPRSSKTILASIMYPAWKWVHRPHNLVINVAHSLKNSRENLGKFSEVVNSNWYKNHWHNKFDLTKQNQDLIKNNIGGTYEAFSVSKKVTGSSANDIIIDDLIDINDTGSVAALNKALKYYQTGLVNRYVGHKSDSTLVINQRLGPKDISAYILEHDHDFTTLRLPMEFIPEKKCYTVKGWGDPRQKRGELLFPHRYNQEWVEKKKSSSPGNTYAVQYQQDPEEGLNNLFDDRWFKPIYDLQEEEKIVKKVRAWDMASGVGSNYDYTVGALLCLTNKGRLFVKHISRFKADMLEKKEKMRQIAQYDGKDTVICIPQDSAASGKEMAIMYQQFLKIYSNYPVKIKLARQSKEARCQTFATYAKENYKNDTPVCYKVDPEWTDDFLYEIKQFPNAKNDDIIDACADAFETIMNKEDSFVMPKLKVRF